MLMTESLMISSTLKPNTSPSPSLTCQSIPEVTLMFLKSSPSLASSYFSSGSFSMEFREYFSSRSQALCVGLMGLYAPWALWSPCSASSGRIMDTNTATASVLPSSVQSRSPAYVCYPHVMDVNSSSKWLLPALPDHHSNL